jgi:hypothetical protein
MSIKLLLLLLLYYLYWQSELKHSEANIFLKYFRILRNAILVRERHKCPYKAIHNLYWRSKLKHLETNTFQIKKYHRILRNAIFRILCPNKAIIKSVLVLRVEALESMYFLKISVNPQKCNLKVLEGLNGI